MYADTAFAFPRQSSTITFDNVRGINPRLITNSARVHFAYPPQQGSTPRGPRRVEPCCGEDFRVKPRGGCKEPQGNKPCYSRKCVKDFNREIYLKQTYLSCLSNLE